MELTQILDAMKSFEARQMVLVTGQALRMLTTGGWEQAKSTPTEAVVDALLRQANPGGRLDAGHCEVRHDATTYWITTETAQGIRAVVITRCNAAGLPLASVPDAQRTFLPGSASAAAPPPRSIATSAITNPGGAAPPAGAIQPAGTASPSWNESPPITAPEPLSRVGSTAERRELGRENDSGTGKNAILPRELAGYNWGAFLNPLFWGAANGAWGWTAAIFGTSFIPIVGWLISLVMTFAFAAKGNELAWQNHYWKDHRHFKRVQRLWWQITLLLWVLAIGLIALEMKWIIGQINTMTGQFDSTINNAQ